jgi:hypothetical protein
MCVFVRPARCDRPGRKMTFYIESLGSCAPVEPSDRWLDAALRAVPLPDGFFQRVGAMTKPIVRVSGRNRSNVFAQPEHKRDNRPR